MHDARRPVKTQILRRLDPALGQEGESREHQHVLSLLPIYFSVLPPPLPKYQI